MIVFCGYANADMTVGVPVLPGAGERVQATRIDRGDGGMGANAAVAAARMGAGVRFAGVVGDDPMSEVFLARLREDGVDTSWTARGGTLTTSVILLTPDGERSIISQDDELTAAHVAEVAARVGGDDLLYLDGYRFPEAADVLGGVRAVVDLDGAETAAAARAALRAAAHVIVGREQAARLIGDDAALAAAAEAAGSHLIVTAGPLGWTLFAPDGERYDGRAISVETVDATGAGDCFAGTYCAEIDRGTAPVEAARFAAVAAGLSCTRPGARDGSPTRAAVRAYLDGSTGPTPPGPREAAEGSEERDPV
ncbi:carbohydrate kinase family protein [Spirillospora sp. NPDC029432]|uniref:carbohydrate kinase family protein n=1 Tax=Spirillospora sp. NPDC029432 TaxID=3154599 RepID=UPI0034564B00